MAIFNQQAINIQCNQLLPEGMHLSAVSSPLPLSQRGLSLPVEISTASVYRAPPQNYPLCSRVVTALFDTGANLTSIDLELAKALKLLVIGQANLRTAAGPQTMPSFAVDISFPSTKLLPFYNLRINSCNLGFDLNDSGNLPNPQNTGILIGRDIMARWNIIWNGPTSLVIISD